jgi:hypothetical protein
MKGQKEAVVEYIKGLGHILPSKVNLPTSEFEFIVDKVVCDIGNDRVSYGKDKTLTQEVRRYVRSMIKNHLNKAPELNGGIRKGTLNNTIVAKKQKGPTLDRGALTPGLTAALDAFTGAKNAT